MFDKALKSATNMLSRREHSVLELARKLENKDFPDEVIDRVINELINARLLSNERYAESYVRMRSGKGYGPARICLELKERGIDKLMVERSQVGQAVWVVRVDPCDEVVQCFLVTLPRGHHAFDRSEYLQRIDITSVLGCSSQSLDTWVHNTGPCRVQRHHLSHYPKTRLTTTQQLIAPGH